MTLRLFLLLLWIGIASAAEPVRGTKLPSASGGHRIALVIGNSAYPAAGALKNPGNDARDIAAKLKRLGFEVIVRTDVRQKDMLRSLTEFGEKIQPGSEALFFYAGHGMQVRGKNYLIPVDAEIRTESAVSSEAVDVDQLLDKLAPARLSMVILDACRNNPFERRFRGGGQGLAQINAPTGTLIAYATAPGRVAADGDGRNGLYTSELLAAMDMPGMKIEDVFKRVRSNVVRKSGEAQTPWESSSLTGDFFFRIPDATSAATAPASSTPTPPADPATIELAFWDGVKDSRDAEAFKTYVEQYPNGRFTALAKVRIRELSIPTSANVSATPQRNAATDFLEGNWEYQQADNYAHVLVHWNPKTEQYEGVLMRHGKISHWVGFVLGEVVWKGKPTNDPRRIRESQLSRVGSNGVSISLQWLDGEFNLDRSSQDELVTSFGKLRRVGTAVGDPREGKDSVNNPASAIMLTGIWVAGDGALYQLGQNGTRLVLKTNSRPVFEDEVVSTYSLVGKVPIANFSEAEFQLTLHGSRLSGNWSRGALTVDKCRVPTDTAEVDGELKQDGRMLLRHARSSYKAATQMSLLGDDSCSGVSVLGRSAVEEVLRGPLGRGGLGAGIIGLSSWWDGGFAAIKFGWQGRLGVTVQPGSHAHASGLRDGDEILGVDGTPISSLSPGEAMLRLHGQPGSNVQLAIRRKGEPTPVSLVIRRIEQ